MKNLSKAIVGIIILVVISPEIGFAQDIPDGLYFNQNPPGLIPEVFAPGIISLDGRYEYFIGFSPDGRECSFGVTNSTWSGCQLYYTRQDSNGSWSPITQAYFQTLNDGWMPFFTYDGNKILYSSGTSQQYANIYVCEKTDGIWGNPVQLPAPVASAWHEWRPTTTINGTLYFSSPRSGGVGNADIYRSELTNGQYLTVENLGTPVNSISLEGAPIVSPKENYMIFESWKPGGYGQGDLYISYMNRDSSWTEPRNAGPAINTEQIEDGAYISPDGKYFFFNRREAYSTSTDTEIHWVDIKAVIGVVLFDHTNHGDTEEIVGPYDVSIGINATEGNEIVPETAVVVSGMSANFTDTTALIAGTEPGEYTGAIPGYGIDGDMAYYFAIQDTSGMWFREPYNAPDSYHSFHVGPDSIPPQILSIDTLEYTIYFNGSQEISCEVADNISIKEVRLIWSKNSGVKDSLLLEIGDNPQHYSGTFTWAGAQTNDVFEYILRVVDDTQNENITDSETLIFKIATHIIIGKFEEQDLNQWDTGDGWGSIYINADAGWGVNDSPGGQYDNNADNSFTLMEPLDLSLFDQAYLSFWHGYFIEPDADFGYVEFSTDNINWISQKTVSGLNVTENAVINLEDYLGENTVYLRFRLTSNESQTYLGWYIDDIELYIKIPPVVSVLDPIVLPDEVTLLSNYPNPFNANTRIDYSLVKIEKISIVVYDLLGTEVKKLVHGVKPAGKYSVIWDGRNDAGETVASGVYFYSLLTENHILTNKLVLLK